MSKEKLGVNKAIGKTKSLEGQNEASPLKEEEPLKEEVFQQIKQAVKNEYYQNIEELAKRYLQEADNEDRAIINKQIKEKTDTYTEHLETDWTIAQEIVAQLRKEGIEITNEEMEDLRISCYLHDAAKLQPYDGFAEMLEQHPARSAEYAQDLLTDKYATLLTKERIRRIVQAIREHGEMPFTSLVAKAHNQRLIEELTLDFTKFPPSRDAALHEIGEEEIEEDLKFQFPRPTSKIAAILNAADNISTGALLDGGAEKIAVTLRCEKDYGNDYEQDMATVNNPHNNINTRLEAAIVNDGLDKNIKYLESRPSPLPEIQQIQEIAAAVGRRYLEEVNDFRTWVNNKGPGFRAIQSGGEEAKQTEINTTKTLENLRAAINAFKKERKEQGRWVS